MLSKLTTENTEKRYFPLCALCGELLQFHIFFFEVVFYYNENRVIFA